MKKICIVGNIGLDILYQVPRLPEMHEKLSTSNMVVASGGAPANVAYWLAQLGHQVHFATLTGTDPLSQMALDSLCSAGVNISSVIQDPQVGPAVASIFTNNSEKCMVCGNTSTRTNSHLWAELVEGLDFSSFDHVHLATALHPLLFHAGRRRDLKLLTLSTDLNGSYSSRLLADLDICFSNHDELTRAIGCVDRTQWLTQDLGNAPFHLVVTNGGNEVSSYQPDELVRVVPPKLEIVDRTGGGDAFCAGYLHAMWHKLPTSEAITSGLKLAGAAFSGFGCRPTTQTAQNIIKQLLDQVS